MYVNWKQHNYFVIQFPTSFCNKIVIKVDLLTPVVVGDGGAVGPGGPGGAGVGAGGPKFLKTTFSN